MKIKLHRAREYTVLTKENRTKEILALGDRNPKIKFHPSREYAVVIK